MSKGIKIIIGIVVIAGIAFGVEKFVLHKNPVSVQTGVAAQQTMQKEMGSVPGTSSANEKVGNYQMSLKDSGIINGGGHVTLSIKNDSNASVPALTSSNFVVKAGNTVLDSSQASFDISSDSGDYAAGKSYDVKINLTLPQNLQGQSISVTLSDNGQSQTITPFIGKQQTS